MSTSDSSHDELHELTDRQLLADLTATEARLDGIQQEIRRRMRQRAATEHRQAQHEEISRMVEHLEQARIDWQRVREFFRESIVEAPDPWGSDT